MVTNSIYNNYFVPKYKPQSFGTRNTPGNAVQQETVDRDGTSKNKQNTTKTQGLDNNRCITKFLNGQESEIQVNDILKDFRATMTAIGVPKTTGMEIMGLLKQVQTESENENPSILKIQQNLCSAADKLDGYVSETLGKPSTVVKQWMDAMLIQKVNYKSEVNPAPQVNQINTDPQTTSIKDNNTSPFAQSLPVKALSNDTSGQSSQVNEFNPTNTTNINAQGKVNTDTTSRIQTSIEVNTTENVEPTISRDSINTQSINNDTQASATKTGHLTLVPKGTSQTIKAQNEAETLFQQAHNEYINGNKEKAIKLYENSALEAIDLGDLKTAIESYSSIANIYDSNHDLNSALKYYGKALELANKSQDTSAMSTIYYDIGSIYDDLNLTDKALEHYHASIALDGELGNVQGQALTLNNIGTLYASNEEYTSALDHYRMAYSLASETEDNTAKANILSNIAYVYTQQNDPSTALEYYKRSLKIDQASGNTIGETKTLISVGELFESVGQTDKANKCFKKALSNSRELNDTNYTAILSEKLAA